MNHLIAVITIIAVLFALAFVAVGGRLVMKLPHVRTLRESKNQLAQVQLKTAVRRGTTIAVMARRLLVDMMTLDPAAGVEARYGHRTLADAIQIVDYREKNIRRIAHELRVYAFLVVVLGVVGFLRVLSAASFELEWNKILGAVDENPLGVLAFFESFMVLLFVVRLVAEINAVRDLLEG